MKSLLEYMSPVSWVYIYISVLVPIAFILEPTWKEMLALLVADLVALAMTRPFESRIYTRLYPDSAVYLKGFDETRIARMSDVEKTALYESLMLFPKRRARFCHIGSFIKVIPAYCVTVFYWEHERSNWMQLFTMIGINLVTFWYFYGAVFIESHSFLSRRLKELHERHDFSEAFARARITSNERDFEFQELMSLTSIIVFMLFLQSLIVFTGPATSPAKFAGQLLLVGLMSSALFFRIWSLGRAFDRDGFQSLFERMDRLDYQNTKPVLALRTDGRLARFGRVFNQMMASLRASERELSLLILRESEKQRYRALGEMSALVAHDLSGPIHAAHYCAEELSAGLPEESRLRTLARSVSTNMKRASELILSLRARLKNPPESSETCGFLDAHRHTLNVLRTQFNAANFEAIRFDLGPELMDLRFRISQVNLIHILDNLYRNSIRNLIESETAEPRIGVSYDGAALILTDNGTGLSPEKFEQLTSFHFSQAPDERQDRSSGGLGLRLTRRLVELHGGSLHALDPRARSMESGTVLRVVITAASFHAVDSDVQPDQTYNRM